MDSASPSPAPSTEPAREPPLRPAGPPVDAAMSAYVGYLAGWFEIGRLAAGRRLTRAGVRDPLLNDS